MRALDELSDTGSAEAVALMIQLAVDAFYRTEWRPMLDWAQRSLDAARPLGDRVLAASAAGVLALAHSFCGAGPEAHAACAEAATRLDDLRDDELAQCLDFAGDVTAATELYLGYHEEAGRHIERTLAVALATGQGQLLPVLFWTGTIRCALGRLEESAEVLDTAVEVARLADHGEGVGWNLFSRSLTAAAAGEADVALATAEEAARALSRVDWSFPVVGSALAMATALAATGEAGRAVEVLLLQAGGEELAHLPICWRPGALELLTRCRLALGQHEDAARSAASARRLADALELRMPAAFADRAEAAVALAAGDAATAAERALASAAAAGEMGRPVEAALSRTLAGRALAAAGDAERAAAELERAAAELEALGALRHRDEAERELGKLGRRRHRRTRPGRGDGVGIETLTERELQVARLVVDRKTNPEIAAELFLSTKTVESHIRNLFHKLDVSSRVDVARVVEGAERER
jgi:DNA-binding NarL/FixJ family response regulator